jgi:hypothetical protein
VLLRQAFGEAAGDGHRAGLDRFEHGAERAHEPLPVKAFTECVPWSHPGAVVARQSQE